MPPCSSVENLIFDGGRGLLDIAIYYYLELDIFLSRCTYPHYGCKHAHI